MTREQLIKHWDIIEAFKNGFEIECTNNILTYEDWKTTNNPSWNENCSYRVKPQPELDPFTFEDNLIFGGKFIRYKEDNNNHYQITGFGIEHVQLSNNKTHFYETILERCVFSDGSPCGKHRKTKI